MSINVIANAHEGDRIPKPTAAEEARIDASLNKIFKDKVSQMSTAEAVPEIETTSSDVAVALLRESGWDIVRELARVIAEGIQSTALVTLPAKANLAEYKAKLSDPEGFEQKLNTLLKDVAGVSGAMLQLFEKHKDKEGKPDSADLELINVLTLGYSKLQGHLETAIHPLMLNLVDELEAAGITDLSIEESVDE